ncbi:MAG: acyltransferase family protein, partial [Christensenellaceae bacterium]
MEQTLKPKPEKHLYLEILRVFAIFGVIFNHTYDKGYFLFATRPIGSFPFWVEMALSIGCKCSVPIFFAISGALLLGKDEPLSVIWRRRILRMAILLLV